MKLQLSWLDVFAPSIKLSPRGSRLYGWKFCMNKWVEYIEYNFCENIDI